MSLSLAIDSGLEPESPLDGVSPESWHAFVNVFLDRNGGVSETLRYGIFDFSVRRLCDLGVMVNPRPLTKRGKLVWVADWLNGVTLKSFLTAKRTQYVLFCRSMKEYAKEIGVQDSVGKSIDNNTTTLSGVLAITHRAGLSGLFSWMTSPAIRKEFSHTTDFFRRANTLF